MAFDAGSVIGKIILDASNWISNAGKVNSSTNMMTGAFNAMNAVVMMAAKALIDFGTESVKKANAWQKEFANVTTVLDTTAVNTQKMAKEVLLLNPALGSSIDLTNGLYQALSASVDPAKAVQFVGDAAKFAQAALVNTNTAVDVITTGLNAYAMSADKASEVSDKFFQVIMLGKVTGEELSASIGKSIPLAANMSISLDELGASMVIMTRQGIKAAQATTQFNSMVSAFIKPSVAMSETIKMLGYESGEAMIKQLGFKGSIDAVIKTTGGSNEVLATMFRNVNALKGVMAITGTAAADFDQVLEKITNSAGSTNTAFEKQEKTFKTLQNAIDTLMIIIGNVGKVFVDQIAVGATKAAEGMIKFLVSAQGAEFVSEIIAQVAAGFEFLKKFLDPIIKVLDTEGKKVWKELNDALDKIFNRTQEGTGIFNIFGIAAQMAASVIKVFGTIIRGVIENIGNLVVAIRDSAGILGTFWDALTGKKKWSEVSDQAKKAGDAFNKFFKDAGENIGDVWNVAFEEGKNFLEKSKNLTTDLEITYKTTYKNVKENTKSTYMEMITGQKDMTNKLVENLNNVTLETEENAEEQKIIEDNKNRYMMTSADIMHKHMVEAQYAAMDAMEQRAKEAAEKMKQDVENITSNIVSIAQPIGDAIGGIITGQEGAWENLKKSALNAIASIIEAYAKQWALLAVASGIALDFVSAAGWAGLSVAGFIGAGVIRGLESGGVGYGLTLVGEGGPELVDFRTPARVYNNTETNNLLSPNINYNPTFIIRDSKDIDVINNKLGSTIKNSVRRI